jgi:two-component system nitrogen regulation sensor histidine kinase NtrY
VAVPLPRPPHHDPLRLVAEGAERIASGERGVRVDFPSGDDEFSALIASFNRMSERLARSEEEVEHTRAGLTRKNEELEDRRRLMETVLETVGTGVVVVDAERRDHRPQRRRLPPARR